MSPVVTPVSAPVAAPVAATLPAVASDAAPVVASVVASDIAPVPKSMYVVVSDENDTAWIKTVTVVTKTEPHASGKTVVYFNPVSLKNIVINCTTHSTSNVDVNDIHQGTIIWVGRTNDSCRAVVLGIVH